MASTYKQESTNNYFLTWCYGIQIQIMLKMDNPPCSNMFLKTIKNYCKKMSLHYIYNIIPTIILPKLIKICLSYMPLSSNLYLKWKSKNWMVLIFLFVLINVLVGSIWVQSMRNKIKDIMFQINWKINFVVICQYFSHINFRNHP